MDTLETSLNEHERIERLKAFFKRYGNGIAIGVLGILLVIGGWQYWQHRSLQKAMEASEWYEKMLSGVKSAQEADLKANANELMTHYASTVYAKMAALALAQNAVSHNQLSEALPALQWVIDRPDQPFLTQLAQIRKARILLALQKPQEALTVLAEETKPIYPSQVARIRSNAYLALGNKVEAKAELEKALKALSPEDPLYSQLQADINAL